MKKIIIGIVFIMLCGCVDLGRIGIHPELRTINMKGDKYAVENCLHSAGLLQNLSLIKGIPFPGGTERYDLQDSNYESVAWVDVSSHGEKQSSVNFYYLPGAPDAHKAVVSMISQCRDDL